MPITDLSLESIQAALHPLDPEPEHECWNLPEMADLLPADQLTTAASVRAAVLVGLVPRKQGLQVLLTRRTDGLRQHGGQVSFPGGRVDPSDASACAAVERESFEEIGLRPWQLTPLGWLDRLATISGFSVLPLVAVVTPDYVARPDPREVASVFELALDYLMTRDNLRSIPIQWRGRARQVLEFVDTGIPGQRVWGATASILYNLRQRLEN